MKSSRKSLPGVNPLLGTLFFSEVTDYGTISDPGVLAPKLRADVFQNVSSLFIGNTDELISKVDSCIPLTSHFSILAADHLSSIEVELDANAAFACA